ncbi:transporter [Paramyrothecium foliicola]|nr:transporter [Paramyrothecium foliicola]
MPATAPFNPPAADLPGKPVVEQWTPPPITQMKENFAELSSIDLSLLDSDDPTVVDGLVQQVKKAIRDDGFLFLENYGVSIEQLHRQFGIAQYMYSNISEEDKERLLFHPETGQWSGYKHPYGFKRTRGLPDGIEQFNWYKADWENIEERVPKCLLPLMDEVEAFANYLTKSVNRRLLTLFSRVLELPDDYLWDNVQSHGSPTGEGYFRHALFRPVKKEIEECSKGLRMHGHTDFGLTTLLFSVPISCLQIWGRDEQWYYVPYRPGALVINIGDTLEIVSGGHFKATRHRVFKPPADQLDQERLSLVLFNSSIGDLRMTPATGSPLIQREGCVEDQGVYSEFKKRTAAGKLVPTNRQWREIQISTCTDPTDNAPEADLGLPSFIVDYNDIPSLTKFLEENNVDTIVSAFGINGTSLSQSQINLIKAADASSVTQRFIPSTFAIKYPKEMEIIHNGTFLNYFFPPTGFKTFYNHGAVVLDVPNAAAGILGTGNEPMVFTYTLDVAKFVEAALDLEQWPAELRITGTRLTFNELVAMAEEARGKNSQLHDKTRIGFIAEHLLMERQEERTPLLAGDLAAPEAVNNRDAGDMWTEFKLLVHSSGPLIAMYLLQYSFTVVVIFVAGHIGSDDLAAASLGATTMNILGFAIYEGMATALDTLCSQAYGSGNLTGVGLHVQRMLILMALVTVPISAVWIGSPWLLALVVKQPRLAIKAGSFLRISLLGMPGYASFEAGKRFLQAQGDFVAATVILIICAPVSAALSWWFAFSFGLGLEGAALGVAIATTLRPILLLLYIIAIPSGRRSLQCWGGFSAKAFQNWGPVIQLSIAGALVNIGEWTAVELINFSTSYVSVDHLAAQTVLTTAAFTLWHVPFSVCVAATTRVGYHVGAGNVATTKRIALLFAVVFSAVGVIDGLLLFGFRGIIVDFFTDDETVRRLAYDAMVVVAAYQIIDSIMNGCNSMLRGLGQQTFAAKAVFAINYLVSVPLAIWLELGPLNLRLHGAWIGLGAGMVMIAIMEVAYMKTIRWEDCIQNAKDREHME